MMRSKEEVLREHGDDATWDGFVRKIAQQEGFHGPLSDAEVEYILWNHTAFPMAGPGYVEEQIRKFFTS